MFRQLFEEGLELQKVRLREQKAYAREQRQEQQRRHQDHIASMENYYKDQVGSHWPGPARLFFFNLTLTDRSNVLLPFLPNSFLFSLKNWHRSGRRSRFGKKLRKR